MRTCACGKQGKTTTKHTSAQRKHGSSSVLSKQRLTGAKVFGSRSIHLDSPLLLGLQFRTNSPRVIESSTGKREKARLGFQRVCVSIAGSRQAKKATEAWIEADIAGYGSPEARSNLDLSAPSVNLKTELAPCSTLAVIGLIRKGTEQISFQNRRIKTTVKRK